MFRINLRNKVTIITGALVVKLVDTKDLKYPSEKYLNTIILYTYERCSNHPHQVHLEILSEQGIIGYLIIIFTVFSILFNSFKIYRKTGDLIHLSSILFVLTFFIPLLPTGGFFSTFNGTIFWINFSFVHAFLNKPSY